MTARADVILSTSETFAYDGLNRLTSTVLNAAGVPGGTQTSTFGYNAIGNITSKTGVGTYAYTSGKPHAVSGVTGTVNGVTNPVYTYDANGNMQTDGTRAFTWTSFDMPLVISKTATGSSPGSGSGTFTYGAEHQRVKQVWTSGGATTTTYYLGEFDFEKVVDSTGSTYKHYVKAGDRIVASVTRAPSTTTVIYILPDHLNSTSVVTDTSGAATFRMPYDAWGDRRSGAPGSVGASDPTNTIQPTMINRGFTGHEMLDQGNLGLVHMNGRVYDPTLARFVSADPQVQAPYSTQSFNRYGYVWNDPLDFADPSGFEVKLPSVTILCGAICQMMAGGESLSNVPQRYNSPINNTYQLNIARRAKFATVGGAVGGSLTLGGCAYFTAGGCMAAAAPVFGAGAALGGALGWAAGGMDFGALTIQESTDSLNSSSDGKQDGADSDQGCVYCVKGEKTQSGKDYIGTADDLDKRAKDKSDGRDRKGAEIVDTYPKGDRDTRRAKEQQAMNDRGGVENLDNKRNEVAEKYWGAAGIRPPIPR